MVSLSYNISKCLNFLYSDVDCKKHKVEMIVKNDINAVFIQFLLTRKRRKLSILFIVSFLYFSSSCKPCKHWVCGGGKIRRYKLGNTYVRVG